MLFTLWKISPSVSSDCAAAANMRKIYFLSIHTQIYIFAAFLLFAVLSCCYTDPLPTELTGSAERLIWGTSTSACFLFPIKSNTDKEFHFVPGASISFTAAQEVERPSNPGEPMSFPEFLEGPSWGWVHQYIAVLSVAINNRYTDGKEWFFISTHIVDLPHCHSQY